MNLKTSMDTDYSSTEARTIAYLSTPEDNGKMSSLDIAKLTGKEHKNVTADIRNLISQGVIDGLNFQLISYTDSMNRQKNAYNLDFDATMVLITGYDPQRRMAVIKRWRELESGQAQPAMVDFNDPSTLRAMLIDYTQKLEAETVRADTAERMGESKVWKKARHIPWLKDYFQLSQGMFASLSERLEQMSDDMGMQIRKVPCYIHGEVNTYHKNVVAELRWKLDTDETFMSKYR
jgi:Rha family phage regulatory protein